MNAPGKIEMLDAPSEVIELAEQPTSAVATHASTALAQQQTQASDDFMLSAMQRGFTPEQISQMMDLRDRQDRYVAEKAFREAFAAFRGENIIVPKTKSVDRGKAGSFVQAEYHVAANLLSPALSRHGFGFRHNQKFGLRKCTIEGVENDIGWVWVTCYLEHRAGHSEKVELEGPPGELSANTPAQNMQATASYLKRQSLLAITGTATGGEDDENNLRRKSAPEAPEDDELAQLTQAGRAAANDGMKALTTWWGSLNAKQRGAMNKEFASMRRGALAVDQGAGNE